MKVPSIKSTQKETPPEETFFLHPEGMFDVEDLGFRGLRQSNHRPEIWSLRIEVTTEHGVVMAYMHGYLPSLLMLERSEEWHKRQPYKVKVRHRRFEDATYAQAELILS